MENTTNFIKCNINDSKSCGKEALCVQDKEKKLEYYCLCSRSGMRMTRGSDCNIKKFLVEPHSSQSKIPIHVQDLGLRLKNPSTSTTYSTTNSTTNPTIYSTTNSTIYSTTNSTIKDVVPPVPAESIAVSNSISVPIYVVLIAVPIGLIVLATVICLIWKYLMCHRFGRKRKPDKNKAAVIQLDKTIVAVERYTSNPQYADTPNTPIDISIGPVPLLSRDSLTDLKKIGEGFFGEVYKGQLHSIDDEKEHVETVAVKRLKQSVNKEALEDFLREVEIISSFQHPNILTLVGVCPRENSSPPWMVFEFMSFGDLAEVLRNNSQQVGKSDDDLPILDMVALLSISSQIAAGMEYLASQRFVHRDLACRNCLVGSALTVKIADFGMSRDVYTCDYYRLGGNRMLPIRWMPPESIEYGRFTLESDVWSYGVVLWEIYTYGKQPYYGYTNEQAMRFILNGISLDIPENCPNEVADIMKSCWKKDKKERIQFLDICNRLSALKENIDQITTPALPRPPPMPVTINYPLPFDDDEFDDNLDDDNYVRPMSQRSSLFLEPCNSSREPSNSSFNAYMEPSP